jgi:hypothetical protein
MIGRFAQEGDDGPSAAKGGQQAVEVLSATSVEYQVDAGGRLLEVGGPVVDHLCGAEVVQEVGVAWRSSRDHLGVDGPRQLHRDMPDTAGAAVNQHALPSLEASVVEQRLPSGESAHRSRRSNRGQVGGSGCQLGFGGGHELGVGSGESWEAQHPEHWVAGREPVGDRAPGDDLTRHVPAQKGGELPERDPAARSGLPIDGVHRGGLDCHQHLTRPRSRRWQRRCGQHIGRADALDDHGSHRVGHCVHPLTCRSTRMGPLQVDAVSGGGSSSPGAILAVRWRPTAWTAKRTWSGWS